MVDFSSSSSSSSEEEMPRFGVLPYQFEPVGPTATESGAATAATVTDAFESVIGYPD